MMLSGRSLFRVREDLRDTPTWPGQLGRAGWTTFITGKWHNGARSLPASFAEGHNVFLGGMTDQNQVKVRDLLPDGTLSPERTAAGPSSETFADSAVRFLKDPRRLDQPFCLYVALTSPHDPRTPPAEFLRPYLAKPPPLPSNFLAQHPFDNGEMTVRDEKLLPWPRTPEAVRQDLAAYYGMISHVDAQVGRILDTLHETQLHTNTLVVFAGDNGLAMGSHGLLGKQNLYEHSMRVPLLVAGPGIPRNRRVGDLVTLHQLAATLCDYAGVPAPDGAEGESLLPTWLGGNGTGGSPKTVLTAYRDIQRAVTDGRWKLIEYPKAQRVQLFDLRRDPDERKDLADEPRFLKQRTRLLNLLREQQRQAGDPLAIP
jgi:arylsulfatase A-like enzyme